MWPNSFLLLDFCLIFISTRTTPLPQPFSPKLSLPSLSPHAHQRLFLPPVISSDLCTPTPDGSWSSPPLLFFSLLPGAPSPSGPYHSLIPRRTSLLLSVPRHPQLRPVTCLSFHRYPCSALYLCTHLIPSGRWDRPDSILFYFFPSFPPPCPSSTFPTTALLSPFFSVYSPPFLLPSRSLVLWFSFGRHPQRLRPTSGTPSLLCLHPKSRSSTFSQSLRTCTMDVAQVFSLVQTMSGCTAYPVSKCMCACASMTEPAPTQRQNQEP